VVGQRIELPLLLALLGAASPASASEVKFQCERLSPAQAEELAARMRILLHAADPEKAPRTVTLVCEPGGSHLDWQGPPNERVPVDDQAGLVEGALDALESRLAQTRAARESEPPPKSAPPAGGPPATKPSPLELPPGLGGVESPHDAAAKPRPASRSPAVGGLDLGVSFEPLPQPLGLAIGPRLHVGVGTGALAIVLGETLRLETGAPFNALLFDVQGGVSLGAPYAPDYRVGAVLLAGWEWLSAFGEGAGPDGLQTDSSPTLCLGLRTSLRLGAYSPWLGVDAIYRIDPPSLGAPFAAHTERVSVLGSIGLLLLVESSRRR
jgi:hypothetical protein